MIWEVKCCIYRVWRPKTDAGVIQFPKVSVVCDWPEMTLQGDLRINLAHGKRIWLSRSVVRPNWRQKAVPHMTALEGAKCVVQTIFLWRHISWPMMTLTFIFWSDVANASTWRYWKPLVSILIRSRFIGENIEWGRFSPPPPANGWGGEPGPRQKKTETPKHPPEKTCLSTPLTKIFHFP